MGFSIAMLVYWRVFNLKKKLYDTLETYTLIKQLFVIIVLLSFNPLNSNYT